MTRENTVRECTFGLLVGIKSSSSSVILNLETWSCRNKLVMASSIANLDWRDDDLHHLGKHFLKNT